MALTAAGLVSLAWNAKAQPPEIAVATFHEVEVSHTSLGNFRGATESWRGAIVLTRSHRQIGGSFISCIRMSPEVRNCYASYSLPEGTMVALGLIGSRDRYSLTIAGGTGAYLVYHGWVSVLNSGDRESDLTFHLDKLSDG